MLLFESRKAKVCLKLMLVGSRPRAFLGILFCLTSLVLRSQHLFTIGVLVLLCGFFFAWVAKIILSLFYE